MKRTQKLLPNDNRLLREIIPKFPASSRFSIDKFIKGIPDDRLRKCFRKKKGRGYEAEKLLIDNSIEAIKQYLVDNDFIVYVGNKGSILAYSTHYTAPADEFYILTERGKRLKSAKCIRGLMILEWANVWGVGFSILFLILNFILTCIIISKT